VKQRPTLSGQGPSLRPPPGYAARPGRPARRRL